MTTTKMFIFLAMVTPFIISSCSSARTGKYASSACEPPIKKGVHCVSPPPGQTIRQFGSLPARLRGKTWLEAFVKENNLPQETTFEYVLSDKTYYVLPTFPTFPK